MLKHLTAKQQREVRRAVALLSAQTKQGAEYIRVGRGGFSGKRFSKEVEARAVRVLQNQGLIHSKSGRGWCGCADVRGYRTYSVQRKELG
jgi:hypothetical protein